MPTPPPNPRLAQQSAERAAAARDLVATVTVDGRTWHVCVGDVSALTARRFRETSGQRILDALAPVFAGVPDVESVASAVLLAELCAGRDATWADVAVRITVGSEITIDIGGAPPDVDEDVIPDPLPPAPAA